MLIKEAKLMRMFKSGLPAIRSNAIAMLQNLSCKIA